MRYRFNGAHPIVWILEIDSKETSTIFLLQFYRDIDLRH